jgi:DNA polymerase-3 subunit beta
MAMSNQKTAKAAKPKAVSASDATAIVIRQSKFLPSLQALAFALDTKSTIPVLGYALFEIADGDARVTATNLDLRITEKLDTVEVTGEGRFLLPLKRLLSFVQHSDGEIKIQAGKEVRITCGNAKVNWQTHDVNSFPDAPPTPDDLFTLSSGRFAKALRAVAMIQADTDQQYTFNNVFLNAASDKLEVAASDGHRLGFAELPPLGKSGAWDVLIPKKAVNPIIRACDAADEVYFGTKHNHFYLRGGERQIFSRLNAGNFPAFGEIIKATDNNPIHFTLNTFALQAALRRVVAACEEGKNTSLLVTVKKGKFVIEVDRRGFQVGVATDAVNIDYDGDTFEFGINHKYLSDACGIADNIVFKFKTNNHAIQLRAEGDEKVLHTVALIKVDSIRALAANEQLKGDDKQEKKAA